MTANRPYARSSRRRLILQLHGSCSQEATRGRSGERILVFEDDPDVRGYVVAALGALSFDVLEAADVEGALGLLNTHGRPAAAHRRRRAWDDRTQAR
jgi:hypothetical protein